MYITVYADNGDDDEEELLVFQILDKDRNYVFVKTWRDALEEEADKGARGAQVRLTVQPWTPWSPYFRPAGPDSTELDVFLGRPCLHLLRVGTAPGDLRQTVNG